MAVSVPSSETTARQAGTSSFEISLEDIRPLLAMPAITPTARTFHKYADTQKNPDGENKPVATMPLSDYFRILWELSMALQDETIHLSSRHLMPGSTSFIMSSISSCKNLGEAMKLIAKSYNLLHGGPYNRVEIKDGLLLYVIDDSEFPYMVKNDDYVHFTMECVLIYLHGMLSFITSRDLRPSLRKVNTRRNRGPLKSHHMDYWNVPLRYQSGHYTLTYDSEAAALPITIPENTMPSSREIYDHVIGMIHQTAATEKDISSISQRVAMALEQGRLDQTDIARHLGFSVATLRRRLNMENTTFRQLSQETLNEKSRMMLSQGYHINDVAEELGFSDFRSFIRAFKNWNNITPTAYQKNIIKESENNFPS